MGTRTGTYAALLRGVNNIGKGKRVAMADIRALFSSLGFENVRTVLNSGNVAFSGPNRVFDDLPALIESALASKLGLTSAVIVLTADDVATVVRENPLAGLANNSSHLLVSVPRVPSDLGRLKPLLEMRWSPEVLALGQRVAYLWCANGVPRSPVWTAVDRALARSGTVRNIATFTKLLDLVEGRSAMKP